MLRKLLTTALSLALLLPAHALADDWEACLTPHAPDFFYAADKSRKLLFQMEKRDGSPAQVRQFACIHGRVEGDKQKEGDLKTPEGVYFITRKITQKLVFMEYGPHAFNLNYPNPADRLARKTGGGIWLHSKGQPIHGITTRGCLAIDQYEITEIVPLLRPGTPVVVAERFIGSPFYDENGSALPVWQEKDAEAPALPTPENAAPAEGGPAEDKPAEAAGLPAPGASCVHAIPLPASPTPAFCEGQTLDAPAILELSGRWLDLREQKSEAIFELYDAKAWPVSSREDFTRQQKRLRKAFKARKDFVPDRGSLRIMRGPGYWVSCHRESYRLKDGPHQGLRALYWKHDGKAWRIIGEVWIETP